MFNPDTAPYLKSFYLPEVETAAQSLGVATSLALIHSDAEIEAVITALGREPGSGLLVMPDSFNNVHRESIIAQSTRNSIPAVYQETEAARDGGLLSYGADFSDIFRRAAGYVDRILRGAKPADLPVQLPAKYVMVINMKTAKVLGLTIPDKLLATTDEVIE
jgi:putative ABC transport system substrate-binding protein